MDEVKKQKQQRKPADSVSEPEDPFEVLEFPLNPEQSLPILPPKPAKKEVVRSRSQTLSSLTESPSHKWNFRRGRSNGGKRPNSTFYSISPTATDVTTPFTRPMMVVDSLRLSGRSQAELLDLMNSVGHVGQCVKLVLGPLNWMCVYVCACVRACGTHPVCRVREWPGLYTTRQTAAPRCFPLTGHTLTLFFMHMVWVMWLMECKEVSYTKVMWVLLRQGGWQIYIRWSCDFWRNTINQ